MKEAVSGGCNASPAISDGVERRELTATRYSQRERTADASTPMPDATDATPTGIDPDNPPADVDELYVATSSHSGGCYHTDRDCRSLRGPPKTRRIEIAADWYDPCSWCVPEEGE